MKTLLRNQFFNIQSNDSVEDIKNRLEKNFYYTFDQFFEADVLKFFMHAAKNGNYSPNIFDHFEKEKFIGSELQLEKKLQIKVSLLMQNEELLKFINKLTTKQTTIKKFSGRIYKLPPQSEGIHWHQDLKDKTRQFALSLNLSCPNFNKSEVNGGELQIRNINGNNIKTIKNRKTGQATLFLVKPNVLEHRVTPVLSNYPRITLAGWFRNG